MHHHHNNTSSTYDHKWPIAAVQVPLFGVLAWSLHEVARNRAFLRRNPQLVGASAGAGWEMRRWFHVSLCVALVARIGALFAEEFLPGDALRDSDSEVCWAISVAHAAPDLLFLTTFSLLILFWAQLYYAVCGVRYSVLRPLFVSVNAVVYANLLVLPFVTGDCKRFRASTYFLMFAVYLMACVSTGYYGVRIVSQLWKGIRAQRAALYVDIDALATRKIVLRRVSVLCVMCTMIFLARSVYCVLAGTVWLNSLGYPRKFNRFAFDAIGYGIVEVVPSILMLSLTAQQSATPASTVVEVDYARLPGGEQPDAYPRAVVNVNGHT